MKPALRKIASKRGPKEQSSTAKPRIDAPPKRGSARGVNSTLGHGYEEAIAFAESLNALPEGRRFAVLLAFFDELTLEGSVPPSSTRHKDIATLFWMQAMGQHKLGEPERLAEMLRRDGSPPPMVADYLASIAERHAPRPRGRPKRSLTRFESIHQALSEMVEEREAYRKFRTRYDELRREHRTAPGGTPSEHASVVLAKELAISTAEVRRRLREGKRWMDPPARANAAERDQSDPNRILVTCAHCHRATSLSVALVEMLLKIS